MKNNTLHKNAKHQKQYTTLKKQCIKAIYYIKNIIKRKKLQNWFAFAHSLSLMIFFLLLGTMAKNKPLR